MSGWVETDPSSDWFAGSPQSGLGSLFVLRSDVDVTPSRPIGFVLPEPQHPEDEDG